ncbi:hypothetical protein SLA2020_046430 [Shorea laevis]
MHDLKKTVLNKNCVEVSICELNILSEITFFCSHYFGSDIETRLNRQPRNIVGMNDDMDNCLSVFKHRGQPLGGEMRRRALSPKELKAAELYVLLNCEEVNPWIAARAIINTSSLSDGGNVYYQDDDPPMPQLVQPSTILNDHVSLASQGGEQMVISEVMQLPYVAEEECVGEDDDEEEEFDGMETSKEEVPNYLTESDSD